MSVLKSILRHVLSIAIALSLTLLLFLVLPLMQAIGEKEQETFEVAEINIALEEPPPDVPEEEEDPPEDPEDPPEPPEIDLDQPTMTDITAIDLPIGFGGPAIPSASTAITLAPDFNKSQSVDNMFESGLLDQPARVLFQAQPKITPVMRRKTPARVVVAFIVDPGGRVAEVTILQGADPAFNTSAINAVKKWRFEPAQRTGKPVEARMRQTIVFPKQD